MNQIYEVMHEFNCGYATAKYILGKQRRGEAYKGHSKHFSKITQDMVRDYTPCIIAGEKVVVKKENGKFRILKTRKDVSGHQRFYLNSRSVMFASLVWLKCHPFEDIPDGYVINHIDNNPQNDDVENLECIPAPLNTSGYKRKASNQYIKNN